MKKFKYEPEGETFKGYVEFQMPDYIERLEIGEKYKSPEYEKLSVSEKAKDQLRLLKEHVTKVHLSTKANLKIDDLEELSFYKEGVELMNEMALLLVLGPSLGNVKK